jgi:hypothetical protein
MNIKIEDEISRLGHLRNAAAAIVDYVRSVSKGSEFQPYTEWTLEPDNWVSLHFPTRYTRRFAITLGVPLHELPVGSMKADSRRQSWGRIYVSSARDLPAAFQCLQYAYDHASNKHRKKNGFPEVPRGG